MDFQRVPIPKDLYDDIKAKINISSFVSVPVCLGELGKRWIADFEKGPKTKAEVLASGSRRSLFPIWMRNLKLNIREIEKGKDIGDMKDTKKDCKTAICIGAGPSLLKYNHLKMLKESNYNGLVISTDRALVDVLKAGVVPDIVNSLDADPTVANFYKSRIVKDHMHKIMGMFSTVVDSAVLKLWKGEKYFYNAKMDSMEPDVISASRAVQLMTLKTVVETGGNVGMCNWFISSWFKMNPICFIGLDLSWPCPIRIEDIEHYSIYHNMHDGVQSKVMACFRRYYNTFFKNECITDYIMDTYYEVFCSWSEAMSVQHNIKSINCTGGGLLDNNIQGLECMWFNDFLKKFKK